MAKKILLIINNQKIAKTIGDFLREFGYQVKLCDNARMAISMVKQIDPQLIVCDDAMPHISGRELARLFKSHSTVSKIPFLLITSKMPSLQDMDQAGFRVEADDFIQLPLNQADFYSIITKWLEGDAKPHSITERMTGPLIETKKKQKAARPWNKGEVTPATLARLFAQLVYAEGSGTLRFKGERRMLRGLIKSGSLVEVISNYIREDTLGKYLIETGRITPSQNDESLKIALSKNIPQGKVLVDMKLIAERELAQLITEQKASKMIRVFSAAWQNAAFEFVSERVSQRNVEMDPYPLEKILLQGIFDEAEIDGLYDIFLSNNKENAAILLSKNFGSVCKKLGLDEKTIQQAREIEGKSILQIRELINEEDDSMLRTAFLLVATRGMRFGDRAEPLPAKKEKKATVPPLIKKEGVIDSGSDSRFPSWDLEAYNKELSEGRTFFNRGDYRNAQSHLKKATEINPESAQALAMLAWANFQVSGREDIAVIFEAKEALKKAISLDDTNDLALLYLGRLLKQEGKDSLAGTYFKRALEANPANEEARREVKLLQIKRRKQRDLGFRS